MKYDKPLIAVLIGMFVVIPIEIYTQIFKYIGLTKISTFEFTSMMMLRKGSWWLGLLAGTGTGGLAVLLIYQATRILGTDYLSIKSAGIGMVTYALIDVLFGTLGKNPNINQSVPGHYVHASAAALAGALAGFLLKKYLFSEQLEEANEAGNIARRYKVLPSPAKKQEHSHEDDGPKSPVKLKRWKHW